MCDQLVILLLELDLLLPVGNTKSTGLIYIGRKKSQRLSTEGKSDDKYGGAVSWDK